MTDAELDAIPETGAYVPEQRIINGKQITVEVRQPALVLWQEPDAPRSVEDSHGGRWLVGTANGVRYKSRLPSYWTGAVEE